MSYDRNYWVTGDVVTADKLNNAEEGIEANDIAIQKKADKQDMPNAYAEIYKIKDYLYFAFYNALDYRYAKEYFETKRIPPVTSGCSAIRNGDFFGRNFDWNYDDNVEIIVSVPSGNNRFASNGIASAFVDFNDTTVGSFKYNELFKIAPFKIVDGINEKGVTITTNVVPTDKGVNTETVPKVELRETICSTMLPRYVLDHFSSALEAVEYLRDYVAIYPPKTLTDTGYESHYMIADETSTFLLEIIDNAVVIVEMTAGSNSTLDGKTYLTNFYLSDVVFNEDGKVYTPETSEGDLNPEDFNLITAHGCGLERYNLIVDNFDSCNTKEGMRELLTALFYTNSYNEDETPFWFTEFVGINNLTVKSPPEDFAEVVASAIEKYSHRTRTEGEYFGTWHTVHSVIYDIKERKMYLITQQEDSDEKEYDLDWRIARLEDRPTPSPTPSGGAMEIEDEDNHITYTFALKIRNGKPIIEYEEKRGVINE